MSNLAVTDYVPRPKGWIGAQAYWYYEHSIRGSLAVRVLEIFQIALETISIVGLWVTFKRRAMIERLRLTAEFQKLPRGKVPLIIETPHKTDSFTYNHLAQFAICEFQIWMKRPGKSWHPIHYPGTDPIFIDTDGANLIVIDRNKTLHYKKVFAEFRKGEIPLKKRHHFEGINLDQFDYYAIDKSQIANWKKYWFSLPVISTVYNVFWGGSDKVDINNYRAISISHRGKFCDHYTNYAGRKHKNVVGTTTLFTLHRDGRTIDTPDPWAGPWAKLSIPLPEDEKTFFEGVAMSTSASTVLILGFEHNKATGIKKMKLLSRHLDVDWNGGNPFFSYSYDEKDEHARVLAPHIEWTEHTLPTNPNLIRKIEIFQTGKGNDARRLRIIGKKDKHWGYFTKNLAQSEWTFCKDDRVYYSNPPYSPSPIDSSSRGKRVEGMWGNNKVEIPFIGSGVEGSAVLLTVGKKVHQLYLRKRISIWNFLGYDWPHVDLIVPKPLREDRDLMNLFGGKVSRPFPSLQ